MGKVTILHSHLDMQLVCQIHVYASTAWAQAHTCSAWAMHKNWVTGLASINTLSPWFGIGHT